MRRIYLDHAATTPARAEALAAMQRHLAGANASSLHAPGRAARAALDAARDAVAAVLGATAREIVFTASGSESVALAIEGVARSAARPGHLVVGATEHAAVLRTVERLEAAGWAATRLGVDAQGRIDPSAFAAALRPQTVLASVMLANNEVGTLAPVAELAAFARRAGVWFHTDAVAAAPFVDLDVARLGVDLLSLASHKVDGPHGAGALYVRAGTPLVPMLVGGSQEFGLRAGTENVAAIAGFAAALTCAANEREAAAARVAALRDRFEAGLCARIAEVRVNAGDAVRLPQISSLGFADVTSAALLVALDLEGIAASAGSACAAGSLEPSHVVAALGIGERYRDGVIRFSLGRSTTVDEIDELLARIPRLVEQVRGATAVV